ncbi:MAG: DNA repair exonuclease [Clostridia bacterium]|nr:DNA repair exonuclease [Clostridia bacterium]MBR2389103.1 DNA repair exonuclease [Clostridia bacterium]
MLKILHTGDLHLDSPLSSLDFNAAEKARDSHRQVFSKMMQYAIQEDVDVILIAGDLFDSKYVSAATKELVIKLFRDFAKPIVIAPGNHDPYSLVPLYKSGALPENVRVFSTEELSRFDFDELELSVYGYAFVTSSLEHSPLAEYNMALGKNPIRLLCAHAELGAPLSKYAPVTVSDIERFGFSYAALGHVHNPPEIKSGGTPISYCGFLFGRSFDELGEGGAYLVTLDGDKTKSKRVVFSEQSFIREELDVSGAADESELSQKISDFIIEKGYGENISLRLTLVGTVDITLTVNEKALEKNRGELALLEIKDRTLPVPDSDYLMRDTSIKGEIYRTLLPKLESEDTDERRLAAKALSVALLALDGHNVSSVLELDENELEGDE